MILDALYRSLEKETPFWLLRFLGKFYGAVQRLRARAYYTGLMPSCRVDCPIISVGNLTSGGTGKTPMTLWLAEAFFRSGRRVAVISRGYRQNSRRAVTVVADPGGLRLTPPEASDEACLIARRLPGVTVLTGADRCRLARYAVTRFGVERIILDDGFQHLRLKRDLNLLLMDAEKPFGNGHLIPGGMLREPPSALARADVVILTRTRDRETAEAAWKKIAPFARGKPFLLADHTPQRWCRLGLNGEDAGEPPRDVPLFAFCGIAKPKSFLDLLKSLKIEPVGFHAFRDHNSFTRKDLQRLTEKARGSGAGAMVCTEKDAVKIDSEWTSLPIFFLEIAWSFVEYPGMRDNESNER